MKLNLELMAMSTTPCRLDQVVIFMPLEIFTIRVVNFAQKLKNMKSQKTLSKKTKTEDYWVCTRCDINSLGKRMCPCPRGSCKAEVVGKVVTTVEVFLNEKKNQKKKKAEQGDLAIFH